MMTDLLISNALEIITLSGPPRVRVREEMEQLSIIPDGAVLISGGVIKERMCTKSSKSEVGFRAHSALPLGSS